MAFVSQFDNSSNQEKQNAMPTSKPLKIQAQKSKLL
jgi:hypothetical protein